MKKKLNLIHECNHLILSSRVVSIFQLEFMMNWQTQLKRKLKIEQGITSVLIQILWTPVLKSRRLKGKPSCENKE